MVKQVKNKTTLKVRSPSRLLAFPGVWAAFFLSYFSLTSRGFTGPLAHVSPVRRRVDVYRQKPVFQDGVE